MQVYFAHSNHAQQAPGMSFQINSSSTYAAQERMCACMPCLCLNVYLWDLNLITAAPCHHHSDLPCYMTRLYEKARDYCPLFVLDGDQVSLLLMFGLVCN